MLPTSIVDCEQWWYGRRQGAVVVPVDDIQTLTFPLGEAVTINTHKTNVPADEHELVAESSNVGVPANDESVEAASTAVGTSDGSTITAATRGSSVISHLPITTATLATGATTTIAGETFGVPVSGSSNEHRSSTLASIPVNGGTPGDPGEATTLVQNGQKPIASAAKDGIIVQQGTNAVTLAAGQELTFNGHTLSAAQGGSALEVDGSVVTATPTGFSRGSSERVETASDSQSANYAAGATGTMEVAPSRSAIPQSSATPGNAALGSVANTGLSLRVLCVFSCVWAGAVLL